MRTRKKLGGGGGVSYTYTQIFNVYSKNITAGGGGGNSAQFFYAYLEGGGGVILTFLVCNERILLRVWGGGLMPDFLCALKNY